MNGRSNRVRFWLENISTEISNIEDIFANNLISDEDIGKDEKSIILTDCNHLLKIIDDIIFKLDRRN